jgi:hypothetical protein
MKTLLSLIATGFVFTALQANAGQYEVYVTQSTYLSPSQVSLSELVQKSIVIDTQAKIVTLPLTAPCAQKLCNRMVESDVLTLNTFKSKNGEVALALATGEIMMNDKPVPVTLQITLNPDHATDISIINSADCKGMRSTFLGSPVTSIRAH